MRSLHSAFLILAVSAGTFAQTLSGTWVDPLGESVRLELVPAGDGRIKGTFVGEEGMIYALDGTLDEYGDPTGTLAGPGGNAEFEAVLDGEFVALDIWPLDDSGEALLELQREYYLGPVGSNIALISDDIRSDPQPANPLAPAPSTPDTDFDGVYAGFINGTPATLTVEQEGASVQARSDANGYIYEIAAEATNGVARGTLTDPQTGADLPAELTLDGPDRVQLIINATDPYSGEVQAVTLMFSRSDGDFDSRPADPGEAIGERDPRVVGLWSKQEIYGGGGPITGAARVFLSLGADGSFAQGGGEVVAGGPGFGGGVGGGQDGLRGEWRSENGSIYARAPGSSWVAIARYHVETNRLMLTDPSSGAREVWYRQQ